MREKVITREYARAMNAMCASGIRACNDVGIWGMRPSEGLETLRKAGYSAHADFFDSLLSSMASFRYFGDYSLDGYRLVGAGLDPQTVKVHSSLGDAVESLKQAVLDYSHSIRNQFVVNVEVVDASGNAILVPMMSESDVQPGASRVYLFNPLTGAHEPYSSPKTAFGRVEETVATIYRDCLAHTAIAAVYRDSDDRIASEWIDHRELVAG